MNFLNNKDTLLNCYFLLFAFWLVSYVAVIPVPINLIVTATLLVIIGSFHSLRLLLSEADGGAAADSKEMLTSADAYKFPVIGSISLFGLYVAFKYFDKDTVNMVLSVYLGVVGIFAIFSSFSKFTSQFLTFTRKYGFKKDFPLIGTVDCLLNTGEWLSLLVAVIFTGIYLKTKHYMLNNIFGICFCIQSIERISVGSYKIGAILLVGLFFYDIFWVFGTDVMVTVAKSFDGPIKILFPRELPAGIFKGSFSLLGLGDIVIPGLFVALLLRFDAMQSGVELKNIENTPFPKPYFIANVISYALGLLCTVGVMFFFNAAQPALLYLVPACLGGSLLVALQKGEFGKLFAYNEESEDKKEKIPGEAESKGDGKISAENKNK